MGGLPRQAALAGTPQTGALPIPVMFTLEESALLSRMLRFVGWALLVVALAAVGYLLWR